MDEGGSDNMERSTNGRREPDFSQLQREYRNMEMNRKAYADESNQVMRRQQSVIEKLKKENELIRNEMIMLTRSTSNNSRQVTSLHQEQITKLQEQVDSFAKKINTENKHLETLSQQITIMRHKVMHQKKHMGGVNAAKENHEMINKQIRILENRLDKALIKFNEALSHNKQLRESIDSLRKERVVFDNIYRKLEKELAEKRKQMANIIELSNQAYEQRDNAQMEVAAIERVNRTEADEYERQISELTDAIEKSQKLSTMKKGDASDSQMKNDLNVDDETILKRKVHKGQWGIAKEKVNVQVSIERVQNFEEAFNKIKAATGISDIEELVNTFIKNEDQNFSLFNYVNEQANEIEKVEEQIQELKQEESKYANESGDDVNQHKQLLKDLEIRLHTTEAAVEKYDTKCNDAQKLINSIKIAIQSVFCKIECNSHHMSEMLGDNVVTEANMMQYLGIIEQRTNEVLQIYAGYQKARETSNINHENEVPHSPSTTSKTAVMPAHQVHMVLGIGPPTPMGHDQLQINPPNLEDYSSDEESEEEEDDARPLTRDELKLKTLKGMRKKSHHQSHHQSQHSSRKKTIKVKK